MPDFTEIVAAPGFHLKEDEDELVWRTADGYPDYRSYTAPHPGDPADRIHYLSSYNMHWDDDADVWVKDVAGLAGFHLAIESQWERTIEWNLDFTLAANAAPRRSMEVRINVDTGDSYWRWNTSLVTSVHYGYGDPALARWEGDHPTAVQRWEVQNTSDSGGAAFIVANGAGKGGWVYASGAQAGGTTFGTIPGHNLFAVFGHTQTVIGSAAEAPLYFITNSLVRGRITPVGTWILGPQAATPQVTAGDLLLPRARYLHGVDAADGSRSHALIGVDNGNRTSIGLGNASLAVFNAVTVAAGVKPVAGYISAVVNGAAALIPYHTP
jgi:hypothetical protein